MEISYNKLWKLLIDKDMNKTDLRSLAPFEFRNNSCLERTKMLLQTFLLEYVPPLECDLSDIMELQPVSK